MVNLDILVNENVVGLPPGMSNDHAIATDATKAPLSVSALTPTSVSPYHHVPSDTSYNTHTTAKQQKSEPAAADGHIGLLNHTLDKLQAIQIRSKESLSIHESLVSPACRLLPPELLGDIFLLCLPQTNYAIPSLNECPLILTRVCRQWRAVALSTPQLWNSLNVSLLRAAEMSGGGFYKSWLERARRVPLSMRIVHDIDLSDGKAESLLNAIQWLQPFLSRCSNLWWHGPPVQGLLDNSVQLSHFQVTSHQADFSVFLPGPTPQLRSAVLRSLIHDLCSLRSINIPWHQLLDLKIQFALVSKATFLEVISLCTQVQQVNMSCLCADVSSQPDQQAVLSKDVVNHSIRRLEINVTRGVLGGYFAALTLPALEELVICFCSPERDPWPHEEFASFITRSNCPLQRLTIRRNKGFEPHLAEYLQMLPGLKTLG